MGDQIDTDYKPLRQAGGYDHNFCFPNDGILKKMALLQSPDASVAMTVYSDLCGMQLYTGNFLDGCKGKDGAVYHRRNTLCMETQCFPNACNTPAFPSSIVSEKQPYDSQTMYQFSWKMVE